MRNEEFAESLLTIVGVDSSAGPFAPHEVQVSVANKPFRMSDAVCIELTLPNRHFQVFMGGLDLAYDQRPLQINHQVVNGSGTKGAACMLIECFLYDRGEIAASAPA